MQTHPQKDILCLISGKLLCGRCQGIYFLTVYLETGVMVPSEPDSNASGGQREVLNLDKPMGVMAACPRTWAVLPTLSPGSPGAGLSLLLEGTAREIVKRE